MDNPCKTCHLSDNEKAACCGCQDWLKWEREQKNTKKYTIDEAIQKLEYLMESDPRSFSNPDCEYGWLFHGIAEVLKILKEVECNNQ